MSRRKPSILDRGYLFAHGLVAIAGPPRSRAMAERLNRRRLELAEAWRHGYLACRRDAQR